MRIAAFNQDLVAAGRARDCLDKLVGYTGSRHVVWPLKNGARSLLPDLIQPEFTAQMETALDAIARAIGQSHS